MLFLLLVNNYGKDHILQLSDNHERRTQSNNAAMQVYRNKMIDEFANHPEQRRAKPLYLEIPRVYIIEREDK